MSGGNFPDSASWDIWSSWQILCSSQNVRRFVPDSRKCVAFVWSYCGVFTRPIFKILMCGRFLCLYVAATSGGNISCQPQHRQVMSCVAASPTQHLRATQVPKRVRASIAHFDNIRPDSRSSTHSGQDPSNNRIVRETPFLLSCVHGVRGWVLPQPFLGTKSKPTKRCPSAQTLVVAYTRAAKREPTTTQHTCVDSTNALMSAISFA